MREIASHPLPHLTFFCVLQNTSQTLAPSRKPSWINSALGISHGMSSILPIPCVVYHRILLSRGWELPVGQGEASSLCYSLCTDALTSWNSQGAEGGGAGHTLYAHLQILSYFRCTKGVDYLKNTIADPLVKIRITC